MRASIAVVVDDKTIVVDTGPDLRAQTVQNTIQSIDGVLYTHGHSDHTNGMDELRYVYILSKKKVPIWADESTMQELQVRFSHSFLDSVDGVYPAVVTPHVFENDQYGKTLDILGVPVMPFWQKHGASGRSLGYRFGDFAYSTDVSGLEHHALEGLRGIDTWLVDCGQFGSQDVVAHANFEMVLAWNAFVKARRVILTHLTPRIDYETCTAQLPAGYEFAYDGMEIEIEIGT
jgi:phosphoribosyl 1,2-cyclic phosphate phosphodiesterase